MSKKVHGNQNLKKYNWAKPVYLIQCVISDIHSFIYSKNVDIIPENKFTAKDFKSLQKSYLKRP